MEIAKKAAKSASGGDMKQLELNWAIDKNDLKHRLEKLKDFLSEGRKVEILLGPKRKGRAATPEECQTVLDKIMDAYMGCKGAHQPKAPEGKIGGVMTLVFAGKKLKKSEEVESQKP